MNTYMAWRLVKFLALAVYAGGVFLGVSSSVQAQRMRALVVSTVGFAGTWTAGYMMLKSSGAQLSTLWVLWAIVASLASLHTLAILAHKERARVVTSALGVGGFVTSVGVMVWRSSDPATNVGITAASIALGAAIVWWVRPGLGDADERVEAASWAWFRWIARLEGTSLILLVLIATPLKYSAGVLLDGGTGLLGWVHGMLFVVFVQALWSTGRALGLGWMWLGGGFFASLVPFGTFVFEGLLVRRGVLHEALREPG
ncbi:MAG: DUF3817 domain-containing protein [Myxococcota bacterium]